MSLFTKHLIINKFNLPGEITDIIKEYVFHKIKKIQTNDKRYKLLKTIPVKVYNNTSNKNYIFMRINEKKYYCLVYYDNIIELQTLLYLRNNNSFYILNKNLYFN
jgi:hypothetical protein